MTTTVTEPPTETQAVLEEEKKTYPPIEKVSIICSKGTLDMAYPGLVMANGARMNGIDAMLFFTFWGLDIVTEKKIDNLHVATVGNPSMPMPTMLGGLPGMESLASAGARDDRDSARQRCRALWLPYGHGHVQARAPGPRASGRRGSDSNGLLRQECRRSDHLYLTPRLSIETHVRHIQPERELL